MNITKQEMQRHKENIKSYKETLETCKGILSNLEKWKYENVDIKFNKQYYTFNNGYRDIHPHQITKPHYKWVSHALEMYISREVTLKLESRKTSHVIEVLTKKIGNVEHWILNAENSLSTLQEFNEEQFIKDLKALKEKHNNPRNWAKLLDDNKYIN